MKLEKKKMLVAKTLNVGKERIAFNRERLPEIKEAITRQDIRDLYTDGAILIKQVRGRRVRPSTNRRRRAGSVRMHVKDGKQKYVKLTRKLRRYLFELLHQGKIAKEQYYTLRKEIRASKFRSKSHMKEHMVFIK